MTSSLSFPTTTMVVALLDRERHVRYFLGCLTRALPGPYANLDTNRLTLVHFCVHGLDLLRYWDDYYGSCDNINVTEQTTTASSTTSSSYHNNGMKIDRQEIIEWIYSLQATPQNGGGFQGGTYLLTKSSNSEEDAVDATDVDQHSTTTPNSTTPPILSSTCENCFGITTNNNADTTYQYGHIAMTYTALCTLRTLGDDLSRVDTISLFQSLLPQLQSPHDGSFQCIPVGSEQDLRFVYCACAICHMLQDWSAMRQDDAVAFIVSCKSWDGALALLPGQEGHGGSTFCGVAALVLMNRLDDVMQQYPKWKLQLVEWCVKRQMGGMQGRPNKVEDTCYSYWIGGTLRLLGYDHLLQHDALQQFVASCQSAVMGGFSKVRGAFPDLLHSFYSLAYWSLSTNPNQFGQDNYHHNNNNDLDTQQQGNDIAGGGEEEATATPLEKEFRLKPLNCTLGICQDRAELFGPTFFP